MTKHDAWIEAHSKAYEGLPEDLVFNLWENDCDLQSENTPALAAALGVQYDPEDESDVEAALLKRATVIYNELLYQVDDDDDDDEWQTTTR